MSLPTLLLREPSATICSRSKLKQGIYPEQPTRLVINIFFNRLGIIFFYACLQSMRLSSRAASNLNTKDEDREMVLTAHAAKRCRQRGIPESVASLILQIGDTFDAKHGLSIVMARTMQSKAELLSEIQHLGLKQRSGWEKAYVVVDHENVVVTAGHRTKKIKTNI